MSLETPEPELPEKRFRLPRRQFLGLTAGALVTVPPTGAFVAGRMFSAPPYRGPESDHFNGTTFFNLHHRRSRGFGDFLKWRFTREQGAWGPPVDGPIGEPPPERVRRGEMRVTFVNHATVLIQMDGLNFLTDPIWSERCSPLSWAGPRRFRPPGIRFEDLPPIDAVFISHNHYDHLDIPTLERLHRTHRPRLFTPLGNAALLEQANIPDTVDMDWWDRGDLEDKVEFFCVPAEHWSGRGTADRGMTLWSGWVLRGASGTLTFAGDTGYGPHLKEIRKRYGPSRMALLPIGAYLPRWFMGPVHMSPADAIQAHQDLEAAHSLAIHHGTFMLADDGQDQPLKALEHELKDSPLSPELFWALEHGEGRDVPT